MVSMKELNLCQASIGNVWNTTSFLVDYDLIKVGLKYTAQHGEYPAKQEFLIKSYWFRINMNR